jgi:TrmH family RNA methyltransferase
MQLISQVKEALSLIEKKKTRRKEGKFVVEGEHLVIEAGPDIEFILYSADMQAVRAASGRGIQCYRISKKVFSLLTSVETPQGVLAVVKKKEYTVRDILDRAGIIVLCVGVQDPGNLGTIIRGADAAGAAGVMLSRGTADLYNQKVIRSTMGSLFHLPVLKIDDLEETVRSFKRSKIKVVGADVSGKDYWRSDLSGPAALLIGNEGAGLPENVLKICDEVVKIPMPGKAESLNAAVSATVIMYEAVRQKWSKE